MPEIDNLSIQIKANATSAGSALDKLSDSIGKLSGAVSGLNTGGLHKLSNGLRNLTSSLQGFNSSGIKTQDFTRLQKNLNALSSVDGSKLSNTANGIIQIGKSLGDLTGISEGVKQLGELVGGIKQLGYKSSGQAIENIPKLASAMRQLMAELSKAPRVSQNLIDMTNALAGLARTGASSGQAVTSLSRSLRTYSERTEVATSRTRSLASRVGMISAAFFWVKRAADQLGKAITSAMDYVETYNYFNVTMDKIGKEFGSDFRRFGYENAETYADSFSARLNDLTSKMTGYNVGKFGELTPTFDKYLGLDPETVMGFQSRVAAVTNSVGLIGESSVNVTKALTMLSADLSSLTNVPLESVMTNLSSGLIGQSRALYKYGIDITNATLQTYAYKHGIDMAVQGMTQADKMQLRILAILDQSKVAWGDQANTLNSVSNQYRILQQQIGNLGRIIGNLFLPVIQKVLPFINGLIIAISRLLQFLGFKIHGGNWLKDIMDGISGGSASMDGLADSTDETASGFDKAAAAAKKLKNVTLGFDELHVLPEQSESGAPGGGAAGAGGGIDLSSDIADALGEYESIWAKAFADAENQAQEFADKIASLLPLVAGIGAALLTWKLAPALLSGVKALAGGMKHLIDTIRLVRAGYGKLALMNAFQGMYGTLTKMIPLLGQVGPIIGAWGAVIGVMVWRFTDLYQNSEKFRTGLERISEVVSGIKTVFTDVFGGVAIVIGDIAEIIGGLVIKFLDFLGIDVTPLILLFEKIKEQIKKVDLDFGDLGITLAGIALLFVPGGQIFGAALLGFEAITFAIRGLGGISEQEWEALKKGWTDAWQSIKEKSAEIWGQIRSFLTETIPQTISDVVTWFGELPDRVYNAIIIFVDKIITWGTETWNQFNTTVAGIITDIATWFGNLPTNIYNAIITFTNNIVTWGTEVGDKFKTEVDTIIANIATWFKDLPEKIYNAITEVYEKIKSIGKYILGGIFDGMKNIGGEVKSFVGNLLGDVQHENEINSPSRLYRDEVGIYMGQGIGEGFVKAIPYITDKAGEVLTAVSGVFASIPKINITASANTDASAQQSNYEDSEKYKEQWNATFTEVLNTFNVFSERMMNAQAVFHDLFNTGWATFNNSLRTSINEYMTSLYDYLHNVLEVIRMTVQSLQNEVIRSVNNMVKALNSVAIETGRWYSYQSSYSMKPIAKLDIGKFEAGGFPDKGLFMYNEGRSAEMLGTINGRTAVANNDQIVQAIKQGVYESMMAVMSQQNQQPIDITVKAELDGDTIYTNQQRVAARRGIDFGMGAFQR